MKKTSPLFLFLIFFYACCVAQAPESIPYQAVVRDASGNLVQSHAVSFRFTILSAGTGGTNLYEETQLGTSGIATNNLGLVTVYIGQGTQVGSNAFSSINWGSGTKYLMVEVDPTGAATPTWTNMGTTQMLSVPYALYAGSSGTAASGGTVQTNSSLTGNGSSGSPLGIATSGVINAMLANSSLTVSPGAGLTGGGSVSLGGTTTLGLADGTASGQVYVTGASPYAPSLETMSQDATIGTTGKITVAGLLGSALPSLAAGYLQYTGSAWAFDNASYLTGNQTITLTGNVTGSGTTSIATTIGAGVVTNAMLAHSTISGIALGSNLDALTIGTGLSGTSYDGSGPVTIANTGVTSVVAGTNVTVSGATGAVTVNAVEHGHVILTGSISYTTTAGAYPTTSLGALTTQYLAQVPMPACTISSMTVLVNSNTLAGNTTVAFYNGATSEASVTVASDIVSTSYTAPAALTWSTGGVTFTSGQLLSVKVTPPTVISGSISLEVIIVY